MTSAWTLGWQGAVTACHRTMHAAYGVVHMVEDDVDTLTKLLAGLGEEADQAQNTQVRDSMTLAGLRD
jgi:conjugal transfer/entry exclusion protein